MEKIISLVCLLSIILLFNACNRTPDVHALSAKDRTSASEVETTQLTTTFTESTTIEKDEANGSGGAIIRPQKYRHAYYSMPAPFADLVDENSFNEWYGEAALVNPNETNKMFMVEFIEHFQITQENFEKANVKWAKVIRNGFDGRPCVNPRDYANQETDEVFNVEILYSFDNEIINHYYLSPDYPYTFDSEFDDAVAAGEYTSQTETWVDVDAMEAEALAKYGSLD